MAAKQQMLVSPPTFLSSLEPHESLKHMMTMRVVLLNRTPSEILCVQGIKYIPLPESAPIMFQGVLAGPAFNLLVNGLHDGDALLLLDVDSVLLSQDLTIAASIMLHGKVNESAGVWLVGKPGLRNVEVWQSWQLHKLRCIMVCACIGEPMTFIQTNNMLLASLAL